MEKILLGLGSNRSYEGLSPVQLLSRACKMISSFTVDANVSSVYRTGAMYVEDQDDFYNMVLEAFYEGTAEELLEKIHEVEAALGRNRANEFRNGPRSLDVDIELFGNQNINTEDLTVPHERMGERAFVLVPFLEVLRENADENSKDLVFYSKKLELLSDQKIQLYLKKADFLKLQND